MGIISIAAEEINTLLIKAISSNDSAINMDWKVNIQRAYVHREDVYCLTKLIVVLTFVDCISISHWKKGRCNEEEKKN